MEGAQCKSCGASIIWVTMESGKLMPVDGGSTITIVWSTASNERGKIYVGRQPHWITCPNAEAHRKSKKGD